MQQENIEIWRGGISGDHLSLEKDIGANISAGSLRGKDGRKGLLVNFHLASAGGGTTIVWVWMGPEKFCELALAMAEANPSGAAVAFKAAKAKL